jgi:hypothetical protein
MKLRRYDTSQNSAKSATKMKLAVFATAMTLLVSATQPFAIASDTASIAASSGARVPGAAEAGGELAVDNIQDIAYTLQMIHQQAINICVESIRKRVNGYELNTMSLSTMPATPLENQSTYLPLRKAWLAFFVGTMEALVQILNEHLTHIDDRTEHSHLPSQCLDEWHGIVSEWKTDIKQLNNQLDFCASLLNESSPGNVEVAKAARSIDNQVTQLDQVLNKASKFLQANLPAS